jgi:hypothetical protein
MMCIQITRLNDSAISACIPDTRSSPSPQEHQHQTRNLSIFPSFHPPYTLLYLFAAWEQHFHLHGFSNPIHDVGITGRLRGQYVYPVNCTTPFDLSNSMITLPPVYDMLSFARPQERCWLSSEMGESYTAYYVLMINSVSLFSPVEIWSCADSHPLFS